MGGHIAQFFSYFFFLFNEVLKVIYFDFIALKNKVIHFFLSNGGKLWKYFEMLLNNELNFGRVMYIRPLKWEMNQVVFL